MTGLSHAGAIHATIAIQADVFAIDIDCGFIAGGTGRAVLLGKLERWKLDIIHVGVIGHKRIIP
jgi:hypothetical protein